MDMDVGLRRRVAVVRALQLGDLLCAVPALRTMRANEPTAHITLIGLPWAGLMVERYPEYLDAHLDFPGWPGIPEAWGDEGATARFIDDARSQPFDVVVQMHGDGTHMNAFAHSLGAGEVVGFVPSEEPASATALPYPWDLPEIDRHLALLQHLGHRAAGTHLEFPVSTTDRAEARTLLAHAGIEAPYAIVHAGSRSPDRRWHAANFAEVSDALARRGIEVLLTGTSTEAGIASDVRTSMAERAHCVAGDTSLGGLAALLEGARVLVCNDTGVAHLAAAIGTPSVVVFTGSDRARWAPLNGDRHRAVGAGRPDRTEDSPATVEVGAVLEALDALLEAM
jgi:ADP-heptose:LPS heptosyltransferase